MSSAPKTSSKKTKRKAALDALEDHPDVEEAIEQIDEDDEAEMAARKAERKKAKLQPKLDIVSVPASPPQKKTKAEQIRELQESMTDEEKQELAQPPTPQALVPVAAAAAVSSKAPSKELIVCTLADAEDYEGPPRSFMAMLNESVVRMLPKVRYGRIRVWHPDQSVLMWLRFIGNKLHDLDFQKPEDVAQIKVRREEEKKPQWDDKEKKRIWKGTGTTYVNFWGEFDQRWDGVKLKGLHLLSPFGYGAYGKVGPTVETGIEGDRGREFDGKAKNDSESSVGIAISNKAWTHLAKNPETYKNPVMETAIEVMKNITKHAATTLFAIPGSLPGWHKEHADDIDDMNKKQKLEFLFKSKAFKGKTEHNDKDNTDVLKASAVCLRKTRPTFKGDVRIEEDISNYKPPSSLYEKIRTDDKGNILIHNRIHVFRCRRPDEVKEGETYDSPFIAIPFEEAVISAYHDVFAIGYSVNIYEWKQKTADITHKILCLIWLNTKEALEGMEASAIETCDPRWAVPMAGHYVGLGKGPQGTVTAEGAVSFVPDPDHAGFSSDAK